MTFFLSVEHECECSALKEAEAEACLRLLQLFHALCLREYALYGELPKARRALGLGEKRAGEIDRETARYLFARVRRGFEAAIRNRTGMPARPRRADAFSLLVVS